MVPVLEPSLCHTNLVEGGDGKPKFIGWTLQEQSQTEVAAIRALPRVLFRISHPGFTDTLPTYFQIVSAILDGRIVMPS